KGRVDLSPIMLNQVLEATLAFMILLLAMSVTAIARVRPTTASNTESNTDADTTGPMPARVVGTMPPPTMWTGAPAPMNGNVRPPAPPRRRSGWLGRARYEARHVRGRMPAQRPPVPAGPPWGPATPPPPGRPQQGSERWV